MRSRDWLILVSGLFRHIGCSADLYRATYIPTTRMKCKVNRADLSRRSIDVGRNLVRATLAAPEAAPRREAVFSRHSIAKAD